MTARRRNSRIPLLSASPRLLGALLLAAISLGAWSLPAGAAGNATTTTTKPKSGKPTTKSTTTTTTTPAPNSATGVAQNASATYDRLAHCVSTNGHLLVVLLVDESGSLKLTDPGAVRVAAAKTALAGLADLADRSSGAATIDVQVAAFSNAFKPINTWSSLTGSSLPGLQGVLDGLKSRNHGMDTDFPSALEGARESLATEAVAAGHSTGVCKAILLFTDGYYDIGVRVSNAERKQFGDTKSYAPKLPLNNQANVNKAQQLGLNYLCGHNGVADQLRTDEVTTFAVGLAAGKLPPNPFLQAIATGSAPGHHCGTRDGTHSGVFLPAQSPGALIGTFDTIATRIAGGSPLGPPVSVTACQQKDCASGRQTFVIDPTLRRVHLFVTMTSPQTAIELTPPTGAPLELKQPTAKTDTRAGAAINSAWPIATAATIDIIPTSSSSGTWGVSLFGPPSGAHGTIEIYTFTDLEPSLVKVPSISIGQPTALVAKVTGLGGKKNDVRLLSSRITALISDPVRGIATQQTMKKQGDQYVLTYTPSSSLTSSVLSLVLHLDAVTFDGVNVSVSSDPVNLPTRLPAGFPVISPPRLTPSAISGRQASQAALLVFSGTPGKPGGCVWVGGVAVSSGPVGVTPMVVHAQGAGSTRTMCVPAPATGGATLALRIKANGRATGTVQGWVRIWSVAGGKQLPTDIPFTLEMTRGIDKTKQLALFLVLLVLGVGIPIVLLQGMNVVSTRFQAVKYVLGANIPVVVRSSGRLSRISDDATEDDLHLYGYDFQPIPSSETPKRFSWAGLRFTAHPPSNPFGVGYATASPEGGEAAVAREGRRVSLALSLAGSWIFLYDPDATDEASKRITGKVTSEGMPPEVHGRLLAFIAQGPVPPQADRLTRDIDGRLQQTARAMSEIATAGRRHRRAAATGQLRKEAAKASAKRIRENKRAAKSAKADKKSNGGGAKDADA